ncbi:LolA family protein [Anaerobacillus sp. MEB173]|uniref:LolA family protein n=1 Tax=Anaerobacillus sp. MEB173 TaxID=3383345 RepID=UPI003F8F7469
MKKTISVLFMGLLLIFIMAGCGEKTQDDIIEDLEKKLNTMTGYKADASMVLQTGNEPQEYNVEIWHQKPSYYRVALQNAKKDQNQIILRNDEGVFVLTPALNKSFRFQSDWPENNSQVYLYESLVGDILMDPERTFTANENHYVFQTNTNYQNKTLHSQEIALNKKDLSPVYVKIMDADFNVLVEVAFSNVQMDASFNDGDFDMDRNMTAALMEEVPTMAEVEEPMPVFFPMYEPQGTTLSSSKQIDGQDGTQVVLSYTGENSFTLIQERSRVATATTPMDIPRGEVVDLGFTVGVLATDDSAKSIRWTYEGVDFFLASKDLSSEEMISIARSVYGTQVK